MLATRASTGSIKSAERVLDILEMLAASDRRKMSLAELGKQLGIPKSSLHGLLRVLVSRGYVDLDGATRTYQLWPRPLGLGNAYLAGLDLHQAARPVMAAVAHLSGETITLDIAHGDAMVTVAREAGRQAIRVVTRLGWPFASYATASGKLMLASLPDDSLDALFPGSELPPFTANTIPTTDKLRQELAAIRRSGVAYAHGEINDAVEAIAVPIVDHDHRFVAALDALVPSHRARPEHLRRIERVMRAGARIASTRMGRPSAAAGLVLGGERHLEEVWGSNGKGEGEPSPPSSPRGGDS